MSPAAGLTILDRGVSRCGLPCQDHLVEDEVEEVGDLRVNTSRHRTDRHATRHHLQQ